MQNSFARKTVAVALSGVLACTGAVGVVGVQATLPTACGVTQQAHAAAKNMKQRGVKFNLKKGKAFTSKMWLAGIGDKKYTVKMTRYKLSTTSSGKRKLTFTVKFTRKWSPTRPEVKKFWDTCGYKYSTDDSVTGGAWFWVIDYQTGQNLETTSELAEKYHVKSKSKFKYSGAKKYYGPSGYWWKLPKTITCKATITFDRDYKKLCIGAGCGNSWLESNKWGAQGYEKRTFPKTSWFRKGKKNMRFKLV